MNWNLVNIYAHKGRLLKDAHGCEMGYELSGHGGWNLYLNRKLYKEDIDGLNLCYELNMAEAKIAED